MKTIDLGKIAGAKGDKGDGIKLKMGECILVDTKEEAGAELLQNENEYTINLKIPKPIDGGGDMKLSVYDKEGKCTDIFAYIKENAMTLEGGEFKGSIYLKEGDPTNDREAASKSYVDKKRLESKSDLALLIDAINKSDLVVERDTSGQFVMYEAVTIPINVDIQNKEIEPVEELILDLAEFEIDEGMHQYLRIEAIDLNMAFETENPPNQYWGEYIRKNLYIENENGEGVGNIVKKIQTPGKFIAKVKMRYANENGTMVRRIAEYTLKCKEFKIYLEKRNKITLPEGE